LSLPQFHDIQAQIARRQRPETRDMTRDLNALHSSVQGNISHYVANKLSLFPGMPGGAHEALVGEAKSQWLLMAGREVDRAVASGDPKRIEALFDIKSTSYLVSPKRIDEIVKLSQGAQAPETMTVPATPEEIANAPVLKARVREKDPAFTKTAPAELTAAGWRGGWMKDATGKLFQKKQKLNAAEAPNG
jgi:hypothetical protein